MSELITPDKAFILAAGFGTRLRPYTNDRPKPLVEVNGRSILSRAIDHLAEAGVKDVMINTHYMADKITDHLKERTPPPNVHFSHEEEILETGGGIKKALAFFEGKPFYVINGDALWSNGSNLSALKRLAETWDERKMDTLLLLQSVSEMGLTSGKGDYDIDLEGKAIRKKNKDGAYMFSGIRIISPKVFENTPDSAFSFLECMDKAEAQRRLHGLVHDGSWHHISTPQDLENVDKAFRKSGE